MQSWWPHYSVHTNLTTTNTRYYSVLGPSWSISDLTGPVPFKAVMTIPGEHTTKPTEAASRTRTQDVVSGGELLRGSRARLVRASSEPGVDKASETGH